MSAGKQWGTTIGMMVDGLAAFLKKGRSGAAEENGRTRQPSVLRIRVGLGAELQQLVGPTLDAHLSQRRLRSIETATQGISVDAIYDATLRSPASADALVKALNELEGVQDVRLEK
jgi:hypothetical protein